MIDMTLDKIFLRVGPRGLYCPFLAEFPPSGVNLADAMTDKSKKHLSFVPYSITRTIFIQFTAALSRPGLLRNAPHEYLKTGMLPMQLVNDALRAKKRKISR
jgi:hypothetical protein